MENQVLPIEATLNQWMVDRLLPEIRHEWGPQSGPPEGIRTEVWRPILQGKVPPPLTGVELGVLACMFDSVAAAMDLQNILRAVDWSAFVDAWRNQGWHPEGRVVPFIEED